MGLYGSIDLAEVLFTLFWLFFIALVLYLHRENKREGYPLEGDGRGSIVPEGFPKTPPAKTYLLTHGGTYEAPHREPPEEIAAQPVAMYTGAPLEPTGNPMLDGVGPAAWAPRRDEPDLSLDGRPRFVPMRYLEGFRVDPRDHDPRHYPVYGCDGELGGTVVDIWVDIVEPMVVFYEVQLPEPNDDRTVMLPVNFCKVGGVKRRVKVRALKGHQFADVPPIASDRQITKLEEDKIYAYYAGGTLYAEPERQEPLL
jgi:photosynthetic reaction center H subunit